MHGRGSSVLHLGRHVYKIADITLNFCFIACSAHELRSSGLEGDATALIAGLRWYRDNWYIGTVVSRLKNHESTDEGIYFDGVGWEFYGQYKLYRNWWAVGGWNILEPDSGQELAGKYKIEYGVLGVRYTFREFQQMIFANARFDSSRTQEGEALGNVYTIGVRWDLP